jgi:hypothetical protein
VKPLEQRNPFLERRFTRESVVLSASVEADGVRASHRGYDTGVTIDPSNDPCITRIANEDVTGAVKRDPCRIVEHGLRGRSAVAAIACLPGAGNDRHRAVSVVNAPNNVMCRFGCIDVPPSVRRDGFGLSSLRADAACEGSDGLRLGGGARSRLVATRKRLAT